MEKEEDASDRASQHRGVQAGLRHVHDRHVPGTNLISGEYTSREAIFGCFSKIFELSKGTYRAELHDILANDEHCAALLHATARHGEKTLDQNYAFISRIRDGQIAELWEAWTEGPAWNEFWS